MKYTIRDGTGTLENAQILTRDMLLSGAFCRLAETHPKQRLLSASALEASIMATLAKSPSQSADIWVFGYGSLVWNPAFHYAETRLGRVHGWHRRFCQWANITRGNPDRPGLVLGLAPGGSCAGVAYRIPREQAEAELALLWQREMITGSYNPHWVSVQLADGAAVSAITFTTNRAHEHYAGVLSDMEVARVLASASGTLGRCADYFFATLEALKELGITDRRLLALKAPVMRLCAEQSEAAYVADAAE